jgi:hypothetical protein
MSCFIFGYFPTKLGTSVDWLEQLIPWTFHWNCPRNKRWANIVQNLHYGNCTGKRDFTLQNIYFCWNFDSRKNIILRNPDGTLHAWGPNTCDRYLNTQVIRSRRNVPGTPRSGHVRRNLAVDILWPIFHDCNKIQGSGAVKEEMVW